MENIKLSIYGNGIIVLALLNYGILKKNELRTDPKLTNRRMKKNEGSFFKLLFFPEIEIGSRISNLNKQLNKQAEDNNKLLQELVKLQKEKLELRKREENRKEIEKRKQTNTESKEVSYTSNYGYTNYILSIRGTESKLNFKHKIA